MRGGPFTALCSGTMHSGPGKVFVRCATCNRIDLDKNEGDLCTRPARKANSTARTWREVLAELVQMHPGDPDDEIVRLYNVAALAGNRMVLHRTPAELRRALRKIRGNHG